MTMTGAARIAGDCEVFLVIGTAAVVYPAASYARLAGMGNALVAEVNLEPTPRPWCAVST